MKEFVELRIPEEHAERFLKDDEGIKVSDSVRKLVLPTNVPLYGEIGKIDLQLQAEGGFFFLGWDFIRKYTASELRSAKLFHGIIATAFEPTGEECGTVYDESTACKICQAGRTQVSNLILDLRKAPRKNDIARTIADEWIVSQRMAQILADNKVTGFDLRPVQHKGRYHDDPVDLSRVPSGRKILQMAEDLGILPHSWEFYVWLNRSEQYDLSIKATEEHALLLEKDPIYRWITTPKWYQLRITSHPISTIPPTKFGIRPFDEDTEGRYRCPLGHVSGLNLLSELWLSKSDWDGSDICQTKDMVGIRRGLLVPTPHLLISSRLYHLMRKENVKGLRIEIAYI